MKKVFATILCCILLLSTLVACTPTQPSDPKDINVAMLDGAPLLALAKMRSDNFAIENGYSVNYQTMTSADTLVAALLNGEPDFAIAPINVAALMHTNGSGYRLAAVTIWGIMHIVSNQNISTLDDLKGETLVAFTKSGTPGITIRQLLTDAGIKFVEDQGASYVVPSDTVHIVYLGTASDVRNAIVAGTLNGITVKHALLAEPVATAIAGATASLPQGQYTAKINVQTEWAKYNNGDIYPQAVLIFHQRLLDQDKAFVDKFIAMAELSAVFAQAQPKAAGELCIELGSTAIPNGTIVEAAANAGRLPMQFTRALEAKAAVQTFLQALLSDTPTLIGGSMPSDNFYYEG